MQPRQIRETVRPVLPSRRYSMVASIVIGFKSSIERVASFGGRNLTAGFLAMPNLDNAGNQIHIGDRIGDPIRSLADATLIIMAGKFFIAGRSLEPEGPYPETKGRGSDLPPALPARYLIDGNFFSRPWRTSSHFFTNRMMTLAIPSDTQYFCERFHVLRPLKLLHLLT